MKFGTLDFDPVENYVDLISDSVEESIKTNSLKDVLVAEIDPEMSDTAAFCEKYQIGADVSVNCVIIEAKRADKTWYAACLVPATIRADINGIVRRELDARKISFAPMETATSLSKMRYGGISPIGLPAEWPILIDTSAAALEHAVIGSGIRQSKLLVSGALLASLPNTRILPLNKS